MTQKCFTVALSLAFKRCLMIFLPLFYFRNVQPELKSLAVGFHTLTIRTLGMINRQIINSGYTNFHIHAQRLGIIHFNFFKRTVKKVLVEIISIFVIMTNKRQRKTVN